jgi:hypothetical protein
VAIPKSVRKGRVAEDCNVFDFQLTAQDMVAAIATPDTGQSAFYDERDPRVVKKLASRTSYFRSAREGGCVGHLDRSYIRAAQRCRTDGHWDDIVAVTGGPVPIRRPRKDCTWTVFFDTGGPDPPRPRSERGPGPPSAVPLTRSIRSPAPGALGPGPRR